MSDLITSTYPIWWDTTVTIFNRYEDPETQQVTWYKSVVEKCFWKYVNKRSYNNGVINEIKETICRIPKDDRFVPIREWDALEDKSDTFTFNTGDILIKGEVDDIIDQYTKGQRATDVLNKYKKYHEAFEVEQFDIDVGPGRCLEHYHIKGE